MMELQLKTQKELLAEKLLRLKPDVTKKDRETVNKDTSYSFPTISAYLGGSVRDLDTAATLIEAFTKLIQARAKKAHIIPLDAVALGVA